MSEDRENNRREAAADGYEVGYGKPPRQHRFPPGKSGNPKGRPKGAKGLKSDLKEELASKATVTFGGEIHTASKQRLAMRALTTRAAVGDKRAVSILIRTIIDVIGVDDENASANRLSKKDQELLDQLLGVLAPVAQLPDDEKAEEGSDE